MLHWLHFSNFNNFSPKGKKWRIYFKCACFSYSEPTSISEPLTGIEPVTFRSQVKCSNHWGTRICMAQKRLLSVLLTTSMFHSILFGLKFEIIIRPRSLISTIRVCTLQHVAFVWPRSPTPSNKVEFSKVECCCVRLAKAWLHFKNVNDFQATCMWFLGTGWSLICKHCRAVCFYSSFSTFQAHSCHNFVFFIF